MVLPLPALPAFTVAVAVGLRLDFQRCLTLLVLLPYPSPPLTDSPSLTLPYLALPRLRPWLQRYTPHTYHLPNAPCPIYA